jgi:hypothetical protein
MSTLCTAAPVTTWAASPRRSPHSLRISAARRLDFHSAGTRRPIWRGLNFTLTTTLGPIDALGEIRLQLLRVSG